MFKSRTVTLQNRLKQANITLALITDDDSIYYYSGYYNYLHMDFGRPTILVVPKDGECLLITPMMELEMAQGMTWVTNIEPWQDGVKNEWQGPLQRAITAIPKAKIGIEPAQMPPLIRAYVDALVERSRQVDIAPVIANMRMVKSAEELQIARHAGQVAEAMMIAGRDAIGVGVPEFEVALATSAAGTRKAAELLEIYYSDAAMSPNTHFLQIMASGSDITMPHHRATPRKMLRGDPVFLCFCGMTNFHRFKLGFDRTFWIENITDSKQEEIYQVTIESQMAALKVIRPGITAEEVHAEYAEVIQGAGYEYPFRCGRATGFSYLEKPQLVFGDKTPLQPGMVLAVDGSVNVINFFRAQVGDSIIVSEDGYELLTVFPKAIDDVVLS